jgi:hypothetical protein
MTRILVTRDDGAVIWNEGVNPTDFDTEHFRRALADRLGWAVGDADSGAVLSLPSAPAQTSHAKSERALAGAL